MKVPKKDKGYDKDGPFVAAQIHPMKACPPIPFALDKKFRTALQKAGNELGPRIVEHKYGGVVKPGRRLTSLIGLVQQHYR